MRRRIYLAAGSYSVTDSIRLGAGDRLRGVPESRFRRAWMRGLVWLRVYREVHTTEELRTALLDERKRT